MSLERIYADDYGYEIQLTVLDVDTDSAADLSAYSTTQQIIIEDPDGNQTTVTAAFESDGSDGVISYTVQDGDIDEAGLWRVRARVTSATARLTTTWARFSVEA
jgi:hypothetical protein